MTSYRNLYAMIQALLVLVLVNLVLSEEYRLIFSHVIYRHGDRAPTNTFPNDKYQDDAWPMGWGQLTPDGIRRMYDLGVCLRKRYANFLSSNFSRNEIYVRSTDVDRALESAQSTLAGLYNSISPSECTPWLKWSPIPVHSVEKKSDYLLQPKAAMRCPTYQAIRNEQDDQYIQEINSNYSSLFEFLKEKTGMDKMDFLGLGPVSGALGRAEDEGWELPEWATQTWNQTSGETVLGILSELRYQRRILEYSSLEKTKYMSGFLTGDIVERMKMKAAGKLKSPSKMVMYSAHDGTVLGLLFALDIFNNKPVPFGGCLIIELHESTINQSQYFVTVHYRNETKNAPFGLVPPGCRSVSVADLYCPLEIFAHAMEQITLYPQSKFEEDCGIWENAGGASKALAGSGFSYKVGLILSFILLYRKSISE